MKFTPAPYIAASLLSTLIAVASPIPTSHTVPVGRSNTPNPFDDTATNFKPAISRDFVFDTRPFALNPAYPSRDDGDLPEQTSSFGEQLPNAEIARPSTAPSSSINNFHWPGRVVRSTTSHEPNRRILTPKRLREQSSQPPQARVVQFLGAPAVTSTDPLNTLTQDMGEMSLVRNSADAPHQPDQRPQKRKKFEGEFTSTCAQPPCVRI